VRKNTMIAKLIEKLNYERKNAIKNGIYHLIQIKFSYYRGIREYHKTKGYLKDTILQSQDNFNEMVSYGEYVNA
ncbi:hypothetical protein ACQKAL_07710, partial [Helicobacter pylori]